MEENNREYTNGEITVYWRPNKCIHATTCYTELIEVFNPRKRPWVNMEGAPTEKIIEIVDKCPTDALTYRWNKDIDKSTKAPAKGDKISITNPAQPVLIKVMKDGPFVITGKIKLTDKEGKEYKTYSITSLCRCGASGNLPFCDGTHRKIGFADQPNDPNLARKEGLNEKNDPQPSSLEITFKPGGSFKVRGKFILKDAEGNTIQTDNYVKLCRCGKSKNQPLCDNLHRNE